MIMPLSLIIFTLHTIVSWALPMLPLIFVAINSSKPIIHYNAYTQMFYMQHFMHYSYRSHVLHHQIDSLWIEATHTINAFKKCRVKLCRAFTRMKWTYLERYTWIWCSTIFAEYYYGRFIQYTAKPTMLS